MVDNEPPEDAPNGGTAVIDFLAGTTQALNLVGADITDQFKAGLVIDYVTTTVDDPDDPITIRISEAVLDYYNVSVIVGGKTYDNTDFKNGLLVVNGDFPNDVEVYVFDGELSSTSIVKAYGLHVDVGDGGQDGYFLEFGKAALADTMIFEFKYEEGYDELWSVTTGVNGEQPISDTLVIVTSPVYAGSKITAVQAVCDTAAIDTSSYEVSIQAMCKIVEVIG